MKNKKKNIQPEQSQAQPNGQQRIDINVLFRRLGEKDFFLDQAHQALGMAQQQIAAMDQRIKELEAENNKLKAPEK